MKILLGKEVLNLSTAVVGEEVHLYFLCEDGVYFSKHIKRPKVDSVGVDECGELTKPVQIHFFK